MISETNITESCETCKKWHDNVPDTWCMKHCVRYMSFKKNDCYEPYKKDTTDAH